MRRVLAIAAGLAVAVAAVVLFAGAGSGSSGRTYKIELDNAFGLTSGADLKVGGVRAGKITGFGLSRDNHALVSVQLTQPGFDSFRADVHCESRPQSLIGEYFIDCQPGHQGKTLKNGATVPVTHTSSTIAADLVGDIMRLPYRQRFRIIIGELGAAVAGRGADLNAAIRRGVPALRETDNLLARLAAQRETIAALTHDAHTVVGALAANRRGIQDFVVQGHRSAEATAERRADLRLTFRRLPAFLHELRPTMADLGRVADSQGPALRNLSASAGQLERFLHDLRPFSDASTPALHALARAGRTGIPSLAAARPTIDLLRAFAGKTPEVSRNLAIILNDLNDRSRAVENDSRAAAQIGRPGAKVGYTGLEALLMYAFNQTVAINAFDQNSHLLRVDGFVNECANYQNLQTLKAKEKSEPGFLAHCRAWLGSHQPGITAPDPSDKSLINSGQVTLQGAGAPRPVSAPAPGARRSASVGAAGSRAAAPASPAGSAPGAAATPSPGATPIPVPDISGALNYLLGP